MADRVTRGLALADAAAQSADMVVLPELWHVGAFNNDALRPNAEPRDGNLVRALIRAGTGDLVLNPNTREVKRGDRVLTLTKTEFDLLEMLMQKPGTVFTREQIYEDIWGYEFETSSKSLDVYIGYLRRKTEENNESRMVFTVRGVGYTVREQ